jgi:hypothetical protein
MAGAFLSIWRGLWYRFYEMDIIQVGAYFIGGGDEFEWT